MYMQKNWADKKNVQIIVENLGFSDLQPKTSVALESGQGPGVIVMQWNWAHLYAPKLLDVSDLAQEMEKKGGVYEIFESGCKADGAWRSVPFGLLGNAMVYREDTLKEVGETEYPETWDEIARVGKVVKQKTNMPFGQACGHSWADPPTMVYPILWSLGGQEVEKDGKTVAINSPETLAAVEFAVEWFKGSMEADMLGWDDASNNQAYLGGRIWSTLNGSSIYFVAKRDNPELAKKSNHAPHFKGPKGRFHIAGPFPLAIPTYVKDQAFRQGVDGHQAQGSRGVGGEEAEEDLRRLAPPDWRSPVIGRAESGWRLQPEHHGWPARASTPGMDFPTQRAQPTVSSRRAAIRSSTCGITKRSRGAENGIGTSLAPTRATGASR